MDYYVCEGGAFFPFLNSRHLTTYMLFHFDYPWCHVTKQRHVCFFVESSLFSLEAAASQLDLTLDIE